MHETPAGVHNYGMLGVCVIGLSMHDQANMALAMREAGAAAYLTNGGSSGPLIDAIRAGASHGEDCDEHS
jgi:DNA-binding NarL/FixJ family response regulator